MVNKYERIGILVEQIAIKKKQIASWETKKSKSERACVIINLLHDEISELEDKIRALV